MKSGSEIQIEHGNWSKVHNAIWEALAKAPLNGSEFRCLMFLFRKTYGFNKKEDTISLQQFEDATDLKRPNVSRTMKTLADKHVIYIIDNGNNRPKTYGFNKYTEQWFTQTVIESDNTSDTETVIESDNTLAQTVIESDNKTVIESDNHKRKKDQSLKKGDDDDLNQVKALTEKLHTIGVALTPFIVDGYMDLANDYGMDAVLRGLTAAAENGKQHRMPYVKACIRNAAQGNDRTQYQEFASTAVSGTMNINVGDFGL